MTDTIGDRIANLIHELKMSQIDFSVKCGISDRTVSNTISNKNLPNLKIIESICKTFDNLNCRWLLTGEGEMFNLPGKVLDNIQTDILNEPRVEYKKECPQCKEYKYIIESLKYTIEALKEDINLKSKAC